ncbi:MAG TPA: ammonia-forming cytochrome c nitrite reductase subunit c552 [Spirochaetota bacterium]|nr:ammonia-forming cytochrome c nitrite reductase subunit c552 [Spirochaetota bacterium]HOD14075.1 ammonia-forming cytochrome c nitrite reductase subunit c552 [Spirochaetota bacterium]HPN13646.1 ammonia-forming cytochrome c nitrite reductase subunit c552 [Spirochaetota bacterium]HQL81447.1 ammonia-forming cytochrome c nitrite reductase subunit c552 [Spirochaetota bacterium]
MKKYGIVILIAVIAAGVFAGCGPSEPQPIKAGLIRDGEFDPAEWGKVYPLEYESWLKTRDPKPTDKSRYKRGWDTDRIVWDKLSEYPYAALLYNGWGFGVEYNEPRGHQYAVTDQVEIDQSRTKPGGVCLACKSPYHRTFVEKHGMKYLTAKFKDALGMLPEKMRREGPSCIDCHKNTDMGLTTNKDHLKRGLEMIGKKDISRQEARILACAQCHITYYVPRDREKKVAGDVQLPWTGGSWGNISIENIIADLLTDFQRIEWKQKVTGFDLPFIRHPEFELFTRQSVHFRAGVACADCHMPYRRSGSYKISDHDVTSPLKADLRACAQCHTESATWLKDQVFATQDRTASLLSRAGYATASAAKLIEIANARRDAGAAVDPGLYEAAKGAYLQAFLRLVFISAENSLGFHNAPETGRVLGDSIAFANRAEALLRQALAKAGVDAPQATPLELAKYLLNRGEKKLGFRREQEIMDPFDMQKYFTPPAAKGL